MAKPLTIPNKALSASPQPEIKFAKIRAVERMYSIGRFTVFKLIKIGAIRSSLIKTSKRARGYRVVDIASLESYLAACASDAEKASSPFKDVSPKPWIKTAVAGCQGPWNGYLPNEWLESSNWVFTVFKFGAAMRSPSDIKNWRAKNGCSETLKPLPPMPQKPLATIIAQDPFFVSFHQPAKELLDKGTYDALEELARGSLYERRKSPEIAAPEDRQHK
jgi:hypothetical protein